MKELFTLYIIEDSYLQTFSHSLKEKHFIVVHYLVEKGKAVIS